jgi:RuvA, C-terminal domain
MAHHRGALVISGTAERIEVRRRGDAVQELGARPPTAEGSDAHVGAEPVARASSKLDAAILGAQARAALTGLGWRPVIARAAVEAAMAQAGDVALERLIFEALRRCPVSKA